VNGIWKYLRDAWRGTGRHRGETPEDLPSVAEERPEPPREPVRADETRVDLPVYRPYVVGQPRPHRRKFRGPSGYVVAYYAARQRLGDSYVPEWS